MLFTIGNLTGAVEAVLCVTTQQQVFRELHKLLDAIVLNSLRPETNLSLLVNTRIQIFDIQKILTHCQQILSDQNQLEKAASQKDTITLIIFESISSNIDIDPYTLNCFFDFVSLWLKNGCFAGQTIAIEHLNTALTVDFVQLTQNYVQKIHSLNSLENAQEKINLSNTDVNNN